MLAFEETWSYDGYQERYFVNCFFKPLLPVLPPFDVIPILEDGKLLTGLHFNLCAQAFSKLGQTSIFMFIIKANVAHESHRLAFFHSFELTTCNPGSFSKTPFDVNFKYG